MQTPKHLHFLGDFQKKYFECSMTFRALHIAVKHLTNGNNIMKKDIDIQGVYQTNKKILNSLQTTLPRKKSESTVTHIG